MFPSFFPGTLTLGSQLKAACVERHPAHPPTRLLVLRCTSQAALSLLYVCVLAGVLCIPPLPVSPLWAGDLSI